eukprot:TRINITY_DN650_c0_g3_i16.p3 TRINITY_DN650_c0_g3~~TRINITY_DN650_c0_g3_i16.p3  ORF type:complete len:128 (+),score=36.69 TRINITY_DN650_c0_g3_i16:273-656(+)
MPEELKDINDIPKEILEECGQLTKENSIQGCKKGSVKIVYTFAANLRKEKPMATGEVSFHDNSKCMYMNISTNKKLVKAIIKTKREENPDLKSKGVCCGRNIRGQDEGPRAPGEGAKSPRSTPQPYH